MKKNVLILSMLCFFAFQVNTLRSQDVRIPLMGESAPSFTAMSTNGEIEFPRDFGKNWKILFSHPKDFTPVCSSELLELAHQQEAYKALGVDIIVLSTDILSMHESWVAALNEISYKDRSPVKIQFPIVDDSKFTVSNKYGMIHPDINIAENIRAVFIIDPKNKIRSINFYPMEIGRNLDEIKRSIVALQTVDKHKDIVTPANWKPGDDVMVPVISQDQKKNIGTTDSQFEQIAWFMTFKKL